eukprot:TRINITY_DN115588_c0_g1_i1.p1 TRINITY_DN115588_c0_g1~~TRINITY_DN115588_c0_g1_i1.p1  ORF type:complete len:310 (-),score=5.05 TRINITY_DN115588_c0_g1_i1:42-971(-)
MCWSYGVSLAAAGAESICLLVLCMRSYRTDRRNALLLLPLVLQEWCQVVLWAHIGSSPTECDSTNRRWSGIVTCVVCFVPAWFSMQPMLVRFSDLSTSAKRGALLGVISATLVGAMLAMVHFAGWIAAVCTYVGPWHHQVWPVLHFQYVFVPGIRGRLIGDAIAVANLLLYGTLSLGMFLGRITLTPTIIGLGASWCFAHVLILVLGAEWGSFWCFSTSLLVFVAFLEPCIIDANPEWYVDVELFAQDVGCLDTPPINLGPTDGQSKAIGKTTLEMLAPAVALDVASPEQLTTKRSPRSAGDHELDALL